MATPLDAVHFWLAQRTAKVLQACTETWVDQRQGMGERAYGERAAITSVLEAEVCEGKECQDEKAESGGRGGGRSRSDEAGRERRAAGLVEDRLRAGVGA